MLHEGVHAPIRLLTFMWHVGRPTAAIHLEFFGQTWLHPKTIKNIQKFWRPRGLLLPLNQLRARQWVCLFCLRQLQMLDSPATCPSPCHSQITNLRKAQVVLLHNFWERYLRGTEYISDIFCYIPLPFNFSVHWSQFKIEIGKKQTPPTSHCNHQLWCNPPSTLPRCWHLVQSDPWSQQGLDKFSCRYLRRCQISSPSGECTHLKARPIGWLELENIWEGEKSWSPTSSNVESQRVFEVGSFKNFTRAR